MSTDTPTQSALFTEEEVYEGDPLRPDTETPTPPAIVAALTRPDREKRVQWLTDQAHGLYDEALYLFLGRRELTASCVLFSGGNDSTTLAHLFRGRATHTLHANTTIGIEDTRQFVRDTSIAWGLPLIEVTADDTYEDLVLGRVKTKKHGEDVWPGGFPGPGAHNVMYQRLKERALDKARHQLGIAGSKKRAAVFIAGRRRQESERRKDIKLYETDGTVIWVSPICMWTKPDLNTYRLIHHDVPRNAVSDTLHMSGECLCGAYAHPGELDEIGDWYPEVRAEIEALEAKARAAGIPEPWCRWGHGQGLPTKGAGRLCSACDVRFMAGQDQLGFDESDAA
jgi:3'-phosphoadenosine 5'-phosphosulfate sulfotransferase (PAPS reductase)/FAD synthetase